LILCKNVQKSIFDLFSLKTSSKPPQPSRGERVPQIAPLIIFQMRPYLESESLNTKTVHWTSIIMVKYLIWTCGKKDINKFKTHPFFFFTKSEKTALHFFGRFREIAGQGAESFLKGAEKTIWIKQGGEAAAEEK